MNDEIVDLELNVMACLLIKPELMSQLVLEDKHFKKHQRMWQFMKAFCEKFKTFDIQLMYSVCKDKFHIVNYLSKLAMVDTSYWNFNLYQKRLIECYEENEKEKILIDTIYKLANELFVRKIGVKEFKQKIDKFYSEFENYNL